MAVKIKIKDFNNTEFDSVADMCRHYGISINLYYTRLKRGYSQKEALTLPLGKRKHEYSIDELQKIKGIKDVHKLAYGLGNGMSISEIKRWDNGKGCFDHNNNYYINFESMCRAYGKYSNKVRSRLRFGWSLKDALEKD